MNEMNECYLIYLGEKEKNEKEQKSRRKGDFWMTKS